MDININGASEYFKNTYGFKVYKISLESGLSCPNRGKNKEGGCIFCSEGGSGEFAEDVTIDIEKGIERGINRVKDKNPNGYIAYFQSYTNTYGDIDYMRNIYFKVINNSKIIGLSIGTRPDCLGEDVIEMLRELNDFKPVYVELGLQTSNDNTARIINRGYESKIYLEGVKKLKDIGINVITHIILGLPGENINDALKTVDYVVKSGSDGIKFHSLFVLKNTVLEKMYLDNRYTPLSEDEYIDWLSKCIQHTPKHIVIHRITGDPPKKILVEPTWTMNKKKVLNDIYKYFKENDICQGKEGK